MIMRFLLTVFLLMVCAAPSVWAKAEHITPERAERAISLAAQADAMAAHCGKPSTLAADYLKTFESQKVEAAMMAGLKTLRTKTTAETKEKIEADKADCKNVDFLLKRLEVMRALKNVAYELNGVDPATVKDNIPPVELLDPGRPPKPPPPPPPPQEQ